MQTIIILNTIGLIVLFAICTIFFIMLLKAYKRATKLEQQIIKNKKEIKKYIRKIKQFVGDDSEHGFNLEENRCVICGKIIPEGRQVCIKCEKKEQQNER